MPTVEDVKRELQSLLRSYDERDEPIFFTGRKDVMGRVHDTVEMLKQKIPKGRTFVMQGAPGAGKTATLTKLIEQTGPDRCIWYGSVPDDNSTLALWNELAEKLTGLRPDEIAATRHSEKQRDVSAGMPGVASGQYGYRQGVSLAPQAITSCRQIKRLADEKKIMKPVVVLIDEIQGIQPESRAGHLVRELHTQAYVPVLLVCAGLSDTPAKLHEAGISRSTQRNKFSIGILSTEETLEGVRCSLEKIQETGVTGTSGDLQNLSQEITERSDNWPRHMTCYLLAVLESLIAQDRPDLSTLDRDAVFVLGDAYRESYYKERRNASGIPVRMIASLYRRISQGTLTKDMCGGILYDQIQHCDTEERHTLMARFPDAIAAIDSVIHSGIVMLDDEETCQIPIPSMMAFILDKEQEELARAL